MRSDPAWRIGRLLRRAPAARVAVAAARGLRRASEGADRGESELRAALASHKPAVADRAGGPSALLPGASNAREVALQLPLLAAYRSAGLRPSIVLFARDARVRSAYEALGVNSFIPFDRYDNRASPRAARALLGDVRSQDDLLDLEWGGVAVGRYAASSMLRATRRGRVDVRHPAEREQVLRHLTHAMDATVAAQRIVGRVVPEAALFVDKGYSPHGPLFDTCLNAGVDAVTCNLSHRPDALMLKRYAPDRRRLHPASLSDATWKGLQPLLGDGDVWAAAHAEIVRCYESGEWFGEVGTQSGTRSATAAELRSALDLPASRPVAVVFPHIFWDATFFWGDDVFDDYEDWFTSTLRHAYADDRYTWVVKVHPANIAKNIRDGVRSMPAEALAMEQLGPVPDHVRVLPADASISTLSLLGVADLCFTVRGTVGIEAAALGVPVLTAGTGRYDGLGFTRDSPSRDAYLETLSDLHLVEPMSEAELAAARLYAFGCFVARPLLLDSVRPRFASDAAATLDVDLGAPGPQGTDVAQLASWFRGRDEDLLDRHAMLAHGGPVTPDAAHAQGGVA